MKTKGLGQIVEVIKAILCMIVSPVVIERWREDFYPFFLLFCVSLFFYGELT